jgi:flagellar hook-basal body complex protein FliE
MKIPFLNSIRTVSRRASVATAILTAAFLLACCPTAQAAYTDNFDDLLVELQTRSSVLSNSTDKVEQKQKKACDKAIKTIFKPADSLGDDVKTAGKVAKDLAKAFPGEFAPVLAIKTVSTNLYDLITELAAELRSEITNELAELQLDVDALPAGNAKTKALAAIAKVQAALLLADAALDNADLFKALDAASKAVASGQKTVEKANNSGGGGGSGQGLTATISSNGTNDNWVADQNTGAEWVQGSGILDVGGERSSGGGTRLTVALCNGFNGQTGTYPLQVSCGGYMENGTFTFYATQSGTLNITECNAGSHTIAGTFSLTASDGNKTFTITGSFDLNNLTVTP